MLLDWNNLTPLSALTGGVLIGVAAAAMALLNGRIAGISGIVGGLLRWPAGERAWRLAFIAGLLLAPVIYRLFAPLPAINVSAGPAMLLLAGFLVGFGSRYGSGCTSGHGICGLSRGSPRSVIATLVFMSTGMGTVFIVRHLIA